MHAVACKLLKDNVYVALSQISSISINITVGFTNNNEKLSRFFFKNIQVKVNTLSFRDLALSIFSLYFALQIIIIATHQLAFHKEVFKTENLFSKKPFACQS